MLFHLSQSTLTMSRHLAQIALLVPDYDQAIQYYTEVLNFTLVEDTDLGNGKRWVIIAPGRSGSCNLLLAKAKNEAQRQAIGNQSGGRVFLFLHTDNFQRDYAHYLKNGVKFTELPRYERYGTVVVFEDIFGNKWDLIERIKATQ